MPAPGFAHSSTACPPCSHSQQDGAEEHRPRADCLPPEHPHSPAQHHSAGRQEQEGQGGVQPAIQQLRGGGRTAVRAADGPGSAGPGGSHGATVSCRSCCPGRLPESSRAPTLLPPQGCRGQLCSCMHCHPCGQPGMWPLALHGSRAPASYIRGSLDQQRRRWPGRLAAWVAGWQRGLGGQQLTCCAVPAPPPFPVQAFLPLDLRTKKTRAIRRRLSKEQVKATTTRQVKRASAFPLRKFALKA